MRAAEIVIERFRPEHFERIELQPSQAYVRAHTPRAKLEELAAAGPAYAALVGDRVLACGGLAERGPDAGILWSFIARDAGRHFVRLHRYVCRFLETVDRPEIFATCRSDFAEGRRWLELLGFDFLTPLGPYGPAGVPHDLFLRVRACRA